MVPCHGSPGSYSTIHSSTPGLGPPHSTAPPRGYIASSWPSSWLHHLQTCPCTFHSNGQNDPPKMQPCSEARQLPQPCPSHFVLLEDPGHLQVFANDVASALHLSFLWPVPLIPSVRQAACPGGPPALGAHTQLRGSHVQHQI